MASGTLQDSDVLAAIDAVTIDGSPITAAQLTTLLQYAAFAMQRDEALSKAALQQAANTASANSGATAVAGFQNAAASAQNSIAALLGGQSF